MTSLKRERQKLVWLRQKTKAQEEWVALLEKTRPVDDALDAAFEREQASAVGHDSDSVPADRSEDALDEQSPLDGEKSAEFSVPPTQRVKRLRALAPHWVRIFQFIGAEGKDGKALTNFLESAKLPISRDAMRTALMTYRREYGLINNPSRGFYVLTDLGRELLAQQTA